VRNHVTRPASFVFAQLIIELVGAKETFSNTKVISEFARKGRVINNNEFQDHTVLKCVGLALSFPWIEILPCLYNLLEKK